MTESAVDDDFLESRHIFEDMIGQEFHIMHLERAQAAFGGSLVVVASCHFAQETKVRTIEGTFDRKTDQFVFLPFTDQFRESARGADKYVARFCVDIAGA